jgi:hypothetical protein
MLKSNPVTAAAALTTAVTLLRAGMGAGSEARAVMEKK